MRDLGAAGELRSKISTLNQYADIAQKCRTTALPPEISMEEECNAAWKDKAVIDQWVDGQWMGWKEISHSSYEHCDNEISHGTYAVFPSTLPFALKRGIEWISKCLSLLSYLAVRGVATVLPLGVPSTALNASAWKVIASRMAEIRHSCRSLVTAN